MDDDSIARPQYMRIADDLRAMILTGKIRKGQTLPPYSQLRQRYDVSLSTVQEAVGLLRDEGYVLSSPGRGTFVVSTRPNGSSSVATMERAIEALTQVVDGLLPAIARLERRMDHLEDDHAAPSGSRDPSTPEPGA